MHNIHVDDGYAFSLFLLIFASLPCVFSFPLIIMARCIDFFINSNLHFFTDTSTSFHPGPPLSPPQALQKKGSPASRNAGKWVPAFHPTSDTSTTNALAALPPLPYFHPVSPSPIVHPIKRPGASTAMYTPTCLVPVLVLQRGRQLLLTW
jgi:hypothetical protein